MIDYTKVDVDKVERIISTVLDARADIAAIDPCPYIQQALAEAVERMQELLEEVAEEGAED
tara:strand:- start:1158 stop:1340 length:183 start_codon:yes stop_codon:yes gene_type:complete